MNRKKKLRGATLLFALILGVGTLAAGGRYDYPRNFGYGMMGGFSSQMGPGGGGYGPGMMGYGPGMMGYGYNYNDRAAEGQSLSLDEIERILTSYVERTFGKDYYFQDLMEFQRNYYVQVGKEGDRLLAAELLIDPYSGRVGPEPGPNMMWNLSYGRMNRWFRLRDGNRAPLSAADAVKAAQEILDSQQTGLTADDHADPFNGYYTLHTLRDGKVAGMLSVNSFTGEVWYHNWHGAFLGEMDSEEDHEGN